MRKPKSLGRVGLSRAITQRAGVSKEDAAYLVDAILQHMREALDRDGVVAIPNFGTFTWIHLPRRLTRHPQMGTDVLIPAQDFLSFRASRALKARIQA